MTKEAIFAAKAVPFMHRLIAAFRLKDFQAAAVPGNMGHESDGFTELHEIGQPAGCGGYGWGQWTGPRRQSFLHWCMTHHLDWKSDEANISYAIFELEGAEHQAIVALSRTRTLEAASDTFEKVYERAGVPALQSRREWSRIALNAFHQS